MLSIQQLTVNKKINKNFDISLLFVVLPIPRKKIKI
jgi:hypothetical protein